MSVFETKLLKMVGEGETLLQQLDNSIDPFVLL